MTLMENLLNLHRVDAQVRGLRSRVDSAARYLRIQERQLQERHDQEEELKRRKLHLQANIGNLENELRVADERIEKLRGELNSAVNNKQYAAVLNELNTVKEERGQTEDRMLEDMEQIESLEGSFGEVEAQISERRKVCDAAQAEYEQRMSDVGERLAELETERATAAAALPPKELSHFDRLAEDYEGEAMSPILEIDRRRREYACGACNMHMPFEQVSALLGGSDVLVTCNACHRILYLQEETRGALAKK